MSGPRLKHGPIHKIAETAKSHCGDGLPDCWVPLVKKMADHILLQTGESDASPFDEAWLESVGFDFERGSETHFGHISIRSCGLNIRRDLAGFDHWEWSLDGQWDIPSPRTRGEVRVLCRLLGAKLKEPT